MDTTRIDKDNLQYFESLLLPHSTEQIRTDAPVFALGAVDDGMACGALVGGPVGSAFYLECLFVAPSCRGRGAGTALLDELLRIAGQMDGLSELRCEFTIGCEDHEKLKAFLQKNGFALENVDDGIVAVPLASLGELAFYKNTQSAVPIRLFSELSDNMIRALDRRLTADAGALFDQPIDKTPLDRDCSTATVKGTNIDACLLIERKSEKLISLAYADAGSSVGSGHVFSSMLITTYRMGLKKYPPDTSVLIQPVTPISQALVARLAPEARALSCAAVRKLR